MDTFDGIYAGRKRMLKAMKDSRVGSFGVQAIILTTLIQLSCLLKLGNQIIYALPICLFWGRFSTLFYIDKFKYISFKSKSVSHKKKWRGLKQESSLSIFLIILICIYYLSTQPSTYELILGLILLILGFTFSLNIPYFLGNKIGGFNGDTCGASVVITETIMLFIHAIFL